MTTTRIRKLHIRDFQQFRRCVVDFTGPDGKANDRICLIGRNGTGKSTILRLLEASLREGVPHSRVVMEVEHDGRLLVVIPVPGDLNTRQAKALDVTDIDLPPDLYADEPRLADALTTAGAVDAVNPLALRPGVDLLAYCPSDTERNVGLALQDVPDTTLNAALALFKGPFPASHVVSSEHIGAMWQVLVYLIKKLESDRQAFETAKENLQKTKAQLIAEFDASHPSPLVGLGQLWNRILEPSGLEFDVEGAQVPVQLSENLRAYIRLRDSKQVVPYGALSSGTRNFIFRVGHLFLLYLNRQIERGFVLIDEPESSLFPDFLFDLMAVYETIFRDATGATRTQMFVATHSPIVAAQFEPHERVVLEWGDGFVTAGRGSAPKGDDPNDLLLRDFHLPNLMGPEGREAWRRYLDLRRQIRSAAAQDKAALVAEAAELAERYQFDVGTRA